MSTGDPHLNLTWLSFWKWREINIDFSLELLFSLELVIILLFWEFVTLALADGFSLEFEWQHVSSRLQDS